MWHVSHLTRILALCVSLAASTAAAQPATTECIGSTAQELFGHGQDAYAVGHYDQAIDCWQRAYALDPRPLIQYNLTQALERIGRLEDAVAALELYVRNSTRDDPRHVEANARLASLRARLASTGFRLTGGPEGGAITVDGQAWGSTPRQDPIAMRPGSHVVEITYANGQRFRSTVVAVAGQVLEVTIRDEDLSEVPVVTATTDTAPVAPAPEPPGHGLLYAGIGGAAVGVGLLAYGFERNAKLGNCEAPNWCANAAAGRTERTLGLVGGGVLFAGGAALIIVDLLRDRGEESPVACAPTGLGGVCRITF